MPALGMAQDSGKLIAWLKKEGERVTEGEPIMEIETDKATVEIEATASGTLGGVVAEAGDDVPVGQVIAWILEAGESVPEAEPAIELEDTAPTEITPPVPATPVAIKIAREHNVDLSRVASASGRIQKADVLAYIDAQNEVAEQPRLTPASPKARRIAVERGIELASISGSGPGGAILADDVLATQVSDQLPVSPLTGQTLPSSNIWRIMADRVTQSWTSTPHFYLMREVNASRIVEWRMVVKQHRDINVTYTDILILVVAAALRDHEWINVTWSQGEIQVQPSINIGLAVATEDGLVVPVIHQADTLKLSEIAEWRQDLVQRAQNHKLRPDDLQGGTFTISNLGMYGVDAFIPIINPPQAAILGVGRIASRVAAVEEHASVQPMMTLTLSYDHRAIDGARGAQFLDRLASYIEQPLQLLEH